MKTVLFISGNAVLWACFKQHKIVDSFTEQITPNASGTYKPGRWMEAKPTNVHLLVDAERSEIDAHPLLEAGSRLRYRSNKNAMQQRLIERFPHAIVQSAAKNIMLGAVLVQHINLSEDARNWLARIERSGISVCSITTVAELLANRCATKCSTSTYIVISSTSQFIRHTFCQSGYALFTRAVGCADSQEQFRQTLSHLKASSLIGHAVPVFAVGMPEECLAGINTLELVSELVSIDAKDNSTGLFLAGLVLESKSTRTNHAHRHATYAMMPFLQRRRRTSLQLQCVVVSAMALLLIGYALSNEWQRTRIVKQFAASKSALRQAIALYRDEALGLSPQSVALSSALLARVELESVSGLSPAILLTVVAEALTQFRELELHELSWIVVDANSPSALSAKVTHVKLAGTVNLPDSLRAQQKVFNAFIAHLEMQKALSKLTVLQTPLMQFEGATGVDPIDSTQMPKFELEFHLNRLASSDA